MNDLPQVVGRALKSTVLIMGELGSIGSEVLKAHHVHEIDMEGWYPAKLRQEIHEAAYKRFGPAALLNFGFSMADYYSQALVTASLDKYQSLMANPQTQEEGLDWFVKTVHTLITRPPKLPSRQRKWTTGFIPNTSDTCNMSSMQCPLYCLTTHHSVKALFEGIWSVSFLTTGILS